MTKVVILAAGAGKRLGVHTKYFNKALIKVGNKAAISHIIDYFPKDYEFIIAIGYLGDMVEQYVKIAHPDIKVTFVDAPKYEGPGSGPGYALLQCERLITDKFYLWTCDTLFKDGSKILDLEKDPEWKEYDWLGYAVADSKDGEYSCMEVVPPNDILEFEEVREFHEKFSKNYTRNAYIGCAFIANYRKFFEGLRWNPKIIQEQQQVSAGIDSLLNYGYSVLARNFTDEWCDIGDLDKLQETRSKFKSKIENLDKEDEEIYFLEDRVVKYFYDSKISKNRHKKAELLKGFIPEILDHSDNFYSYKYLEGVDLFDRSIKHKLPELCTSVLETIWNSGLWKEKSLNPEEYVKFQQCCMDFYYRKTKNRVDSLYKKLHFEDTENIINGELVPKLKDIFSVLSWQKILSGKPCLMHGDMALSNIILSEKQDEVKFIDWRQDFGGIVEYGDMYYDLAKMYATLLFPHDLIKEKKFSISMKGNEIDYIINQPEDNRYEKSKENFEKWLTSKDIDIKKVQQLTSIVLLNMSPLHHSPLNILLYYQGKHTLWQSLKK